MSNSHGIPTIHTATTTDGTPANEITFEVVTTVADQERGLGGRTHIDPNYAMLFVFPKASTWGFWMKDMQIPIDIIWVSDTGSIITIAPSVSPDSYPHVFYPSAPAQYVLEMRAGEAAARGWHVGSVVQLPLPYRKSISQ